MAAGVAAGAAVRRRRTPAARRTDERPGRGRRGPLASSRRSRRRQHVVAEPEREGDHRARASSGRPTTAAVAGARCWSVRSAVDAAANVAGPTDGEGRPPGSRGRPPCGGRGGGAEPAWRPGARPAPGASPRRVQPPPARRRTAARGPRRRVAPRRLAQPAHPAAVGVSVGPGGVAAGRCRHSGRRGRSASSATMAATLDSPLAGSVERARRTRAARSGEPMPARPASVPRPQAGEAELQQRAQGGDVALLGAGGRRDGQQADQPVGPQHDVLGGEAADGEPDPVRLGDALGQPAQDQRGPRARAAGRRRPAARRACALDPLVDHVGGAAGARVAGALGGVVDHGQRGGGQAAGGQRAGDPRAGGRAAGGVHAERDVAVEHPVLGAPGADDAGGGRLVGADLVQRAVAVGQAGCRRRHGRCRPPAPVPAAGRPLRRRRVGRRPVTRVPSRARTAASGSRHLRNADDHETRESRAADDHGTDEHAARATLPRTRRAASGTTPPPSRAPPRRPTPAATGPPVRPVSRVAQDAEPAAQRHAAETQPTT